MNKDSYEYTTVKNRLKLIFRDREIVKAMTHSAKNLHNKTLYLQRQRIFDEGKSTPYNEFYHEFKGLPEYKMLPSQVAQQVLKVLCESLTSFEELTKKVENGTYHEKVNLPRYKPYDGHCEIHFTKAHFRVCKEGKNSGRTLLLTIPKYLQQQHGIKFLEVPLPANVDLAKLQEVHIEPRKGYHMISYIIRGKKKKQKDKNKSKHQPKLHERFLSIDPGVNNLLACIDNVGNKPIIVNGREIKSINQYYNKEISKLKKIAKKHNGLYTTNRISKLFYQRSNKIKDHFHKIANAIIKHCVDNGITLIIFGRNKYWKQNVNHGKRNNQNFVQIPFALMIEYLEYKGDKYGIEVCTQQESHTSKCDALALEPVRHHDVYAGRRTKRGLFKSSTGVCINSDINGAMNIARKHFVSANKSKGDVLDTQDINAWVQELAISGLVYNPVKLSYKDKFTKPPLQDALSS